MVHLHYITLHADVLLYFYVYFITYTAVQANTHTLYLHKDNKPRMWYVFK